MFYLRAERKGLQLDCGCAPGVPQFVRIDQGKLRQVLINLLGNAVKFTEEGGITLWVEQVGEWANGQMGKWGDRQMGKWSSEQAPGLADLQISSVLRFEVRDTGVGIAPHELDAVFDAFVQTESGQRSQVGTGLGLPISRQYVRMMGGDLTVQSEMGVGTVFLFDLPVELVDAGDIIGAEPERRVVRLRAGQEPADGGPYRLLVVDDVASSRTLLVKLLMSIGSPSSGLEIREAANGQEAISVWQAWRPHLIFMDIRMPVMDGREATRHIKATSQGERTSIIALTASAFEEERAISLATGCDDFIRKPLRAAAVFEALGKQLGVQYEYEAPSVADRREQDGGEDLKMRMAALPVELVAQLRTVTKLCDMAAIDRLVAEIQSYDVSLADVLARLAHDFEYDQILALVGGASDDR
jgi:two-component system sensor histidine kinase/response regulator